LSVAVGGMKNTFAPHWLVASVQMGDGTVKTGVPSCA
jgi:hypothetical protein